MRTSRCPSFCVLIASGQFTEVTVWQHSEANATERSFATYSSKEEGTNYTTQRARGSTGVRQKAEEARECHGPGAFAVVCLGRNGSRRVGKFLKQA